MQKAVIKIAHPYTQPIICLPCCRHFLCVGSPTLNLNDLHLEEAENSVLNFMLSPLPQSACCSVTQLCPTICDPMDCNPPGFSVHNNLPEFCSNSCPLSQWCHPIISSSAVPFSSYPQSFPASGSFQMSQLFASGGQSIRVSASTIPTIFLICYLGWL